MMQQLSAFAGTVPAWAWWLAGLVAFVLILNVLGVVAWSRIMRDDTEMYEEAMRQPDSPRSTLARMEKD